MKKSIVYTFLVITILACLTIVHAGTSHGVIGFVDNATDHTDANGATVTFRVFHSGNNYCNLTDIVGKNGNSGQGNWYAQDIGNCETDWQVGDIVNISIIKNSDHTANTSLTLTQNGSDQAPDTQLSSPSGSSSNPVAFAFIPEDGSTSTSNSIPFVLKCQDDLGPSSISIYGNWSGWGVKATNSSPVNNSNWTTTITLSNGAYKWAAYCSDGSNSNITMNKTFFVHSVNSPGGGGGTVQGNITNQCGDGFCNKTSANFNFTCNAFSNQSIKNVTLFGDWNGGWHASQIMPLTNGWSNVTVFFQEIIYAGTYTWNCYACSLSSCFFVSSDNYTLDAEIEGSESQTNCCTDCGCQDGYTCSNSSCQQNTNCGDGTCGSGESQTNCCRDCGCPENSTCTNLGCISTQGPSGCGDNYCDPSTENIANCPIDCIGVITPENAVGSNNGTSSCGDKTCEKGENSANCCIDCGCPKGETCNKNKCSKNGFASFISGIWESLTKGPWWIIILVVILLVAGYFIFRMMNKQENLIKIIANIEKELEKKKYNESQKVTYHERKFDFEKQNKVIDKNITKGLEICRRKLKETIEKAEIKALEQFIEEKKEILHSLALLFEDYRKIIRKERVSFEEDLKEVLYSEEIPRFNELKKETTSLYSLDKQIKEMKLTSLRGFR